MGGACGARTNIDLPALGGDGSRSASVTVTATSTIASTTAVATAVPTTRATTTTTSSASSRSSAGVQETGTGGSCSIAGIYGRLGGHAGIRAAVGRVLAAELSDPEEATYFFFQLDGTPGHPSLDQIAECFTDLIATAAGGPETYPPDGGVTDDAGTWRCRADQVALHRPLLISGGTFDAFITIAAGELAALGVQSCDIATLGSALDSFKGAIVTPSLADAGKEPFPGDAAGH